MKDKLPAVLTVLAVIGFIAGVFYAMDAMSPNLSDYERVLLDQGYSEVHLNGSRFIIPPKDQIIFNQQFSAKSPSNAEIRGIVTYQPGYGFTVRLD